MILKMLGRGQRSLRQRWNSLRNTGPGPSLTIGVTRNSEMLGSFDSIHEDWLCEYTTEHCGDAGRRATAPSAFSTHFGIELGDPSLSGA